MNETNRTASKQPQNQQDGEIVQSISVSRFRSAAYGKARMTECDDVPDRGDTLSPRNKSCTNA